MHYIYIYINTIINGCNYTHIDDEYYSINITDYVQESLNSHTFFFDFIANTKVFYRRSKSHSVLSVLNRGDYPLFFFFYFFVCTCNFMILEFQEITRVCSCHFAILEFQEITRRRRFSTVHDHIDCPCRLIPEGLKLSVLSLRSARAAQLRDVPEGGGWRRRRPPGSREMFCSS